MFFSRYYETAKKFNVDIIIRITSDCPVIDPEILDDMINFFKAENCKYKLDYLSNTLERTFPGGWMLKFFFWSAAKNI